MSAYRTNSAPAAPQRPALTRWQSVLSQELLRIAGAEDLAPAARALSA